MLQKAAIDESSVDQGKTQGTNFLHARATGLATTNSFLHIRSPMFRIMQSEDDEIVNEGMYGKACAIYLQEKLTNRGYKIPSFCAEDWGWWLDVADFDFSFGIGIYGQQIGTTDDLDLCVTVLTPKGKQWSWKRFRRVDTTPHVARLHDTMRNIFQTDPKVTVIRESADFPLE